MNRIGNELIIYKVDMIDIKEREIRVAKNRQARHDQFIADHKSTDEVAKNRQARHDQFIADHKELA